VARPDSARLARGPDALPGLPKPLRVIAVIDDPQVV
jgi:hypothetical protein